MGAATRLVLVLLALVHGLGLSGSEEEDVDHSLEYEEYELPTGYRPYSGRTSSHVGGGVGGLERHLEGTRLRVDLATSLAEHVAASTRLSSPNYHHVGLSPAMALASDR